MSLAYKVSAWNRRRKWHLFLSEIQPTPATTILDVGFSEQEYSNTDNYLEKLRLIRKFSSERDEREK